MIEWAYPPLSLVDETLCKKIALISQGNDFSLIPLGKCAMYYRGELQMNAIYSNFNNFESALFMKSVSMPLMITIMDCYDRINYCCVISVLVR